MPFLISIASSFFGWFSRVVFIKFLVLTAVLVVVTALTPLVLGYVSSAVGTSSLSSSFGGIPSGVWFFLDFFALDVGVPLLISAHVFRFLIRRIPFIG